MNMIAFLECLLKIVTNIYGYENKPTFTSWELYIIDCLKSFKTTAKSWCLVTFENYECLNLSPFTHPVVFIDSFIMELKVLPNTNQASILIMIILRGVGGGRGGLASLPASETFNPFSFYQTGVFAVFVGCFESSCWLALEHIQQSFPLGISISLLLDFVSESDCFPGCKLLDSGDLSSELPQLLGLHT